MAFINPKNQLVASLVLAGMGLALFFSGELSVLGLRLGGFGPWLFVIGTWFFVDAVVSTPESEAEQLIAPGEWQAWIESAFVAAILWQLWRGLPAFQLPVPIHQNPDAGFSAKGIGHLFVAWAILHWVLHQRWGKAVLTDERDDQIKKQASRVGYCVTVIAVIGLAVTLGFSPTERLRQFSYPWFAQVMMILLVVGAWAQSLSAGLQYWRQRRAARA